MSRIPVLVPSMPTAEQLLPYLERIDGARHYTNFGPLSAEFEERVAASVRTVDGAPLEPGRVTTVANASLGIELGLQALGLRPGARVLMPTITFVATAAIVERLGMVPVLADVDASSWSLEVTMAEHASAAGTIDAVLPVATFGREQDPALWDAFTRRSGLPVLIDAAGAFGNQRVGRTTDVVFSFHATKSFGCGEGGAVCSSDPARIARIRRLSNFGIDTTRGVAIEAGMNAKMSEYHAAVGLATFAQWPSIVARRIALAAEYRRALEAVLSGVEFQAKAADGVYPTLPILLPDGWDAEHTARALDAAGIGTRRWYCPPLHRHPAFAAVRRATAALPIAERLEARLLGIPFHLALSSADVARVVAALVAAGQAQPMEHARG